MALSQTGSGLWVERRFEAKADRIQQATVPPDVTAGQAESRFRSFTQFLDAIRIPWVYACVSLLAYSFAANASALLDADDEALDDPRDPFLQLWARPNPVQSGFQWRELAMMYLVLTGNVYISLEERDGYGRPRELYLPSPARMRVIPDPQKFVKGYVYDVYGQGFGGAAQGLSVKQGFIPYDADEIVHLRMSNPTSDYYGLGVVEAIAPLLDRVVSRDQQLLAYWQSGGRIIGVLETEQTLSEEDFERLKREWALANRDTRQRVRTAILEKGLKYTPVAEGLRALDVVNIDKGDRDQILAAIGVPAPKLGIMENAQYKLQDADQTFWSETMQPYFDRWSDGLQPLVDLFHPDRRLEFERKNFEDDTTKLENAARMLNAGFSVDEARVYTGADPLPNGAGQVMLVSTAYTLVPVSGMGTLAEQNLEPPEPTGGDTTTDAEPADDGADDAEGGGELVRLADHLKAAGGQFVDPEEDELRRKAREAAVRRQIAGRKAVTGPMGRVLAMERKRISTTPRQSTAPRTSVRRPGTAQALLAGRQRVIDANLREFAPRIAAAFSAQRKRITQPRRLNALVKDAQDAHRSVYADPAVNEKDRSRVAREKVAEVIRPVWDGTPLRDALVPVYIAALSAGYRQGRALLPPAKQALIPHRKAIAPLPMSDVSVMPGSELSQYVTAQFPRIGEQINRQWQSIDDTTFQGIADQVAEGVRRGYTPLQIANGFADEEYAGISGVFDKATSYRAEMIARTETAQVYNRGSWAAYADAGVGEVEVVDGIDDPECADANGTVLRMGEDGEPIEEGFPLEDHPNGTRAFIPIAESITGSFLDDTAAGGEG